MNSDLILRARLEEAGHYHDDIVKIYGGAGAAAEKLHHRLPFVGAKMQDKALGRTPGTTIADKHKIKAEKQQTRKQAYEDAQTAKGNKPIDYGQNVTSMNKPLPNAQNPDGTPVTAGQMAQAEQAEVQTQTSQSTDNQQSNYPVLTPVRNADGSPAQPAQPEQPEQPEHGDHAAS